LPPISFLSPWWNQLAPEVGLEPTAGRVRGAAAGEGQPWGSVGYPMIGVLGSYPKYSTANSNSALAIRRR
jgi:hypothetical protein